MKPSYEELLYTVAKQQKIIERLEKRVAELEERLGLNSSNSSKPPSTDQKKNKQKPKGGARKGHQGHFRKLSEHVDQRIISTMNQCQHCGSGNLTQRASQLFDQIDLPEIKPFVTRIECCKYHCKECGRKQVASFPEGYDKTNFGPKLIS